MKKQIRIFILIKKEMIFLFTKIKILIQNAFLKYRFYENYEKNHKYKFNFANSYDLLIHVRGGDYFPRSSETIYTSSLFLL